MALVIALLLRKVIAKQSTIVIPMNCNKTLPLLNGVPFSDGYTMLSPSKGF
jgi:hypothetical protein